MTREDSPTQLRIVQVGNYRFTGKILGKGTFATVEEAAHTGLKVKVAVKMINLAKCNPYIQKHIKREASILSQLNHPHILRVFEALMFNTTYCLVTEIVQGGDLCAFLQRQRGKHLDEKTTRAFTRQIVTALNYLHDKGIVHRDLKLENIMLDSRHETLKLVDFGLSNEWSSLQPLRTLCGSPEYSAPELFIPGSQYGPEVDMWALGIVMYAMAAGQLPFPCLSSVLKVPEKRNVFIQMINNGLSENNLEKLKLFDVGFSKFIKKLIQPNPNKRYSIKDAMKDSWLNNLNHWTSQGFETLDSYDEAKILRKICDLLKVSEDVVKLDLQVRPCGEIAGFYNILSFRKIQLRKMETKRFVKSTSIGRSYGFPSSTKSSVTRSEKYNRICVIGSGTKINELRKDKSSLQSKPKTGLLKHQSAQESQRSFFTKSKWSSGTESNQDKSERTPRKIGPFKCRILEEPSLTSPKSISRESDKLCKTPVKFKDRYFSIQQPILPSKFKLRYPICKVNTNQIQLIVN